MQFAGIALSELTRGQQNHEHPVGHASPIAILHLGISSKALQGPRSGGPEGPYDIRAEFFRAGSQAGWDLLHAVERLKAHGNLGSIRSIGNSSRGCRQGRGHGQARPTIITAGALILWNPRGCPFNA